VLGVSAVALVATVVLAEGVHTDLLSHVELVSDRGGAGVKPVTVLGGKLRCAGGLNVLSPLKYIIIKNKAGDWAKGVALTSGILILLPFFRCLENAEMNSAAETSLTVFPCWLMRARCC
jgi:hypothetical protein